jgi:ornithine cyclodeaminase/alanine dehydrogenase-like protein (mu-crystallin family)
MELRIIGAEQVIELLPMRECIEVIEHAMQRASEGDAIMPLRNAISLPQGGKFGWMPGYLGDPSVCGSKLVGVFEGNFDLGMHSHNGVVVLFETEYGRPFAIVDAAEITAIRTAAASAMATRLLARPESTCLAILGYGAQARQHLEAMLCVRDFTQVRVWGRDPIKARAFCAEHANRYEIPIEAKESARAASEGADVICTVTGSPTPILHGEWIVPGQHINAVGTSFPGIRELDGPAVARSRLFVDLRESALAQAGEFQMARDEGLIDDDHILGEIGEISLGQVEGRLTAEDVTLYKSLGLVVQDLAAAHHVYKKAVTRGVGVVSPF